MFSHFIGLSKLGIFYQFRANVDRCWGDFGGEHAQSWGDFGQVQATSTNSGAIVPKHNTGQKMCRAVPAKGWPVNISVVAVTRSEIANPVLQEILHPPPEEKQRYFTVLRFRGP